MLQRTRRLTAMRPTTMRLATMLLATVPLAIAAAPAPLAAAAEAVPIAVDRVWSGTRVSFGAVAAGGYVFVAYYDAARQMKMARIDLRTRAVETVSLPTRFDGWDSHRGTEIAIDSAHIVHVAGNMHASRLEYFHGSTPFALPDPVAAPMVGEAESRVTYPTFLHTGTGGLFFIYRDGISGDGDWLADAWNGHAWHRAAEAPIFGDHERGDAGGRSVSAYPSAFVPDGGGRFHVAAVWRHTGDIATNFRVSYAWTTDFAHWFTRAGRAVGLPMTPATMETVDDPGERAGLLNPPELALDPQGTPVIAFSRYNARGRNAVFAATPAADGWRLRELGASTGRAEVRGTGTLTFASMGPITFDADGMPRVRATFRGDRPADPAEAAADPAAPPSLAAAYAPFADHPPGLAAPQVSTVAVTAADRPGQPRVGVLVWTNQQSNQDRERPCTPAEPTACTPPAVLLRFVPVAN